MSAGMKVAMAGAIGGTAEALGGGKFANGAVTGAYVMMFNHVQSQIERQKNDEIWRNFERKDFSVIGDSERVAHILNAIKHANEKGRIDVDLNVIFDNYSPNVVGNQGYRSGLVNISMGDEIVLFQIDIATPSRLRQNRNTVINFYAGTTVNRNIRGKDWTFYKNSDFQWGTTSNHFDFVLKFLKY